MLNLHSQLGPSQWLSGDLLNASKDDSAFRVSAKWLQVERTNALTILFPNVKW